MSTFELQPTPAANLREGDRILHPDLGPITLTSKPLRLRGRGVDQQWVTLRGTDVHGVPIANGEVHEGDYFDKIIGEDQ